MKNVKLPALEQYKWDGKEMKAVPRGVIPLHMIHYMIAREQMTKDNEKADASKKMSMKQIIRKVRGDFKKMSDDDLKKLRALQEEDRARYESQLEEYEKKGYFTMANGAKSNTVHGKAKPRSKTPTSMPKKQKTMGKKK